MSKFTTLIGCGVAIAFLLGLATTLTRSPMIGFKDVLPVYILMGLVIVMMLYEAFFDKKTDYSPYFLLLIQPIFMATNTIVARGGVEYVPPISLAFWRWFTVFLILFPFFYNEIIQKKKIFKKEFLKLSFLGAMGCGVCGAFPFFIAGLSTSMANMGIIYTSSPVFIILLSILFFNEKINFNRIFGLVLCLTGVFIIISKGNLQFFLNFKFTSGDIWMIGAALGWALYSIYLLNWKSKFSLMTRFTLIAFFGFLSLLPVYVLGSIYFPESDYFSKTYYNKSFFPLGFVCGNITKYYSVYTIF